MCSLGRSIINKKGDGSQVKESTDSSSTTLEDDDVKGKSDYIYFLSISYYEYSTCIDNVLCIMYKLFEF